MHRSGQQPFHVAFCVDDNYFRSMGATISSLIEHNRHVRFVFHVFVFSIADDHRRRLREMEIRFGTSAQIHIIDPAVFQQFSHFIRSSYYSASIFARLLIPPILQGVARKVLYLDADILCVGDIAELVQMDVSGTIAAVVSDAVATSARRRVELGLCRPRYFNSGVMLMNIDLWMTNRITETTIDTIMKRGKNFRFPDQDALNVVLDGRAKFIAGKWNYLYGLVGDLERGRTTMRPVDDAVFIHFAGAVKPWNDWCLHESRDLFYKYHASSCWADMPLDQAPQNYKEMRMHSRFLLRRGRVLDSLGWYVSYLKARPRSFLFPLFHPELLMSTPLIPRDLLEKSGKILFVAHLALGDYTYLQGCFRAFSQAWPHIKIHLWVDERRRTSRASEWEHLKKYALYDWLAECRYIEKVYDRTYSPATFAQSLHEAQQQDYPIVVSLAVLERHKYATLARSISPHGFVVGQKKRVRFYDIPKHLIYRKLDAHIPAYTAASHPGQHISDIYAGWFSRLFGVEVPQALRFPVLDIPEKWIRYARQQVGAWGLARGEKIVFLNSFSKSRERNWPFERLIELIRAIRRQEKWRDSGFIINVVPEELESVRKLFAHRLPEHTYLFSADENFFQLPAMLSLCDLIVSVETAVMHLANAVHVPVIALMRKKNPEWAPIDTKNSTVITVAGKDDWVDRITVEQVMAELPE
jgi:heptosyltransferase-3